MSDHNPYSTPDANLEEQGHVSDINADLNSDSLLNRKTFFIREHVGMLKLSDTYDILNPGTQQHLGIAKEKPGALIHILRFIVNKSMLPTAVFVYEGNDPENESKLLFCIKKKFSIFRPVVNVIDPSGKVVGWFKSKAFSLGGAFRVFDSNGREIALVKGDWKGWNFKFTDNSQKEIGTITKKWAGIGKELFTSADNYMISIGEDTNPNHAMLLLAAGLSVDTVYKEK